MSQSLVPRVCSTCAYGSMKPLEGANAEHREYDGAHYPTWLYQWTDGLRVELFKHRGQSASNNGISSRTDTVVLVGVVDLESIDSPHEVQLLDPYARHARPAADTPPVVLVRRHAGMAAGSHYLVPVGAEGGYLSSGWMASGVFGRGDSRFNELTGSLQPVSLHDRREDDKQIP